MMKIRLYTYLLFLVCCLSANAQDDNDHTDLPKPLSVGVAEKYSKAHIDDSLTLNPLQLNLPELNSYTASPMIMPTGYWGGYDIWNLHPGLNASFGMSVTVGLGKHSYPGAGFAQNLSIMYATQISEKFSLAIGGYYNHLNWNNAGFNDTGISAVLGYHIDEKWDAFVYAQKSLMNPKIPLPMRYMNDIGDRIGTMVSYKITPSTTISVSIETDRRR
jgi:hypothetical protein